MESMFANLHTWGYLILFLYSLGGGFLALAAAGVLSSAGELNIVLYGDRIILIKKFIYGLKTLVPIAIGITKYSFLKFSVINAVSSLIWALVVGLLSYYAGDFVRELYAHVKDAPWIAPLALGAVVAAIVLYFRFATRKRG